MKSRAKNVAQKIAGTSGNIKVFQTLRTVNLERAQMFVPATYLYEQHRYDFDADLAKQLPVFQNHPLKSAMIILRNKIAILEVNEPLMREGLVGSSLAILALKLNPKNARTTLVVSYAMENLDPFLRPTPRLRSYVRRWLDRMISKFVYRQVDRLVYATPSAQQLYSTLLGTAPTQDAELIEHLPSVCACREHHKDVPSVVFVGDFSHRKGLDALLDAWPSIFERNPEATLTIIGKGQLEERVQELIAKRAECKALIDPPRREIHEALSQGHVLVMPSRRTARWREQVGLPICEGLAHACHVVTSDETGLASWLTANGHTVIREPRIDTDLPSAVDAALKSAMQGTADVTGLPPVDGRQMADSWLHRK